MNGTAIKLGDDETERLKKELVIWIVTVRADGTPQPSPVWFLWDGGGFLIFSQPKAQKVRNIARNRQVALHLNSDESGGSVLIFNGEAEIDRRVTSAAQAPLYLEKYKEEIPQIDLTPESFAEMYATAIRVKPTHVRTL